MDASTKLRNRRGYPESAFSDLGCKQTIPCPYALPANSRVSVKTFTFSPTSM
jgi:hypothetical protein